MHDLYMDPMVLKIQPQYETQHTHGLGSTQNVDMTDGTHSPRDSPQQHYSSQFDWSPSTHTSFEPHYTSNAPYQTSYSSPQPLHPLNTTTLWPSQLTNPSTSSPSSLLPLPPRPLAPATQDSPRETASIPSPPSPPKVTPNLSNSRKTLTDSDRRRMCKYHEENPTVKQTEIGALFGVERSTVSKVLRNKEKYLVAEDGRRSPVKKSKSKFPDIERTLSNWARNRMSEGLPIGDDLIRDEARKFASTLGSAECHSQVNDAVWLEKFKQKNQLPGARPKGEKITADNVSPKTNFQTPNATAPVVSWDGMPIKDEVETKSPRGLFDNPNPWGHTHTQSTTSMGSGFSDATFATDFRSPTSPMFFTPMSSCGPSPSVPAGKAPKLPMLAPAKLHRRQTVPRVGSGEASPTSASSKTAAVGLPVSDSGHDDMDISPIGIDTSVAHQSRPATTIPMHGSAHSASTSTTSPFSMGPPSTTATTISTNISPLIGSAISPSSNASPSCPPSQDEARVALETLKKFIEHQPPGSIDPHDYLVMGKWMQMLRLEGRGLPGGMTSMNSVPMAERADGTAPMGRKRSEHSLS
ncbi:uncharacterized protein KY384_001037 [Bacidia gigantensis]|uniref:uncharacterized protein n=1 Tax=Bacidia gigantensis TaxID=2732470 RepID=UPI001D04B8B9|nr:uncharacterized protein KY384_001037 [Bacidia gigantensis]KAG8534193.1 hypothetical protein KY384_001037 [Bacidia gigantensis]